MDLWKQWHVVKVTPRVWWIRSVKPKKGQNGSNKLLVLAPYLNAPKKYVARIVEFYISLGFDVCYCFITVTEFLFPTEGAQVCN